MTLLARDICNATVRWRSKLLICELDLHHEDDHSDHVHAWDEKGNVRVVTE